MAAISTIVPFLFRAKGALASSARYLLMFGLMDSKAAFPNYVMLGLYAEIPSLDAATKEEA